MLQVYYTASGLNYPTKGIPQACGHTIFTKYWYPTTCMCCDTTIKELSHDLLDLTYTIHFRDESCSSTHEPVDDLYLQIFTRLQCAHEHGLVGLVDRHGYVTLVEMSINLKPIFHIDLLCLRVAQTPRSPNLAIFVQTDDRHS